MGNWRAAALVYLEPRVLAMLFLGFSAGVPLALTGQTLQVWMREAGVSLAVIGYFALVGTPYTLKFLWAPAVDAVRIPLLTRWLGRRRSWLVATQVLLAVAILLLGLNDPIARPELTALLAILVAVCSATQDIVIDAFRVESLEQSRLAAGMANYVAGYRVALLVSTAVAFEIASRFQLDGFPGSAGWGATYAIMAALIGVGLIVACLSREPEQPAGRTAPETLAGRFRTAVVDPFRDFVQRPDWLAILLFVTLFKFGDAFAGVMTAPFVIDIGFDKTDYGRVVKVFGFFATLLGGFLGGYLFRLVSVPTALWTAGILQLVSNFMFVWLAEAGPQMGLLIATVAIENLTGGIGTVVFVAYLSSLCENRSYTATQYALLSALSAVGRTNLSAFAGKLAEEVGWTWFFLASVGLAIPGLTLLAWIARRNGNKS